MLNERRLVYKKLALIETKAKLHKVNVLMITTLILIVFVLGYAAIAFEHTIHINKAASALITGVLCWTLFIIQHDNADSVNEELLYHFGEISSILFFFWVL